MQDIQSLITQLSGSDEGLNTIKESLESDFHKERPFVPNAGPQTEAYTSEADILLYGGQAGGGKSALINGLAINEHDRSLIIRKQFTDLQGLIDTAKQIVGTNDGFVGGNRPIYKKPDGGVIHYEGYGDASDISSKQGVAHDGIFVDEAAQLPESAIRLLMGWLRTTIKGQRLRMVLASNPPLDTVGDWMISFFAPWLDETHENPAKAGELRWFVTDEDGNDIEVAGKNDYIEIDGEKYYPMSRTFIPASVDDNPFIDDKYKSTLNSLPEPFRSALRDGNFMNSRQDDEWQVIPTAWIRLAQKRWKEHGRPVDVPMCAIGVDIAQGGADKTILAKRYDGYFEELVEVEGKDTPDGPSVAGLIFKEMRGTPSIVIDMGGGYGGDTLTQLKQNDIPNNRLVAYKGAEKAAGRTKDKTMKFTNKRSETYWRMREALDPSQDGGSPIMLPDDPRLVSDLTSPTFEVTPNGIKVEPKDKLVKRLGRSPDKGDAVVMAWSSGNKIENIMGGWQSYSKSNATPKVVMGHANKRKLSRR